MKLKGEMSMLNVLHLQDTDIDKVCQELQRKRDEAPQFFMQSPLIVDCNELGDDVSSIDFSAFKEFLLELGFIPVGVRNIPANLTALLAKNGWAVMRANTQPIVEKNTAEKVKEEITEPQSELQQKPVVPTAIMQEAKPSVTIDRPVRSGQQVYAAGSDMTVLAPTSAGSEVMADGSIHIYGSLRGRVLAGARGNESARIFCNILQAELVAIAGRYQLLDDLDTNLIGKPAMIRLEGEKLIIEPLS